MRITARVSHKMLVAAALLVAPATASSQSLPTIKIATANALALRRAEPRAEPVATLPLNAVVEVLDKEGEWYWVMLARDAQGTQRSAWVHASDVEGAADGRSIGAKRSAPEPAKPSKKDLQRMKKAELELEAARRHYEETLKAK